jgi:hypothetical protein
MGKAIMLMKGGGFFGTAALATATGTSQADMARALETGHAFGIFVRIEGKGWRMSTKEENAGPLADMRGEFRLSCGGRRLWARG